MWLNSEKIMTPHITSRRGLGMAIMSFISDIRNAAIANAVIVVFQF